MAAPDNADSRAAPGSLWKEALKVREKILDVFDAERINPVTLLFQIGYLTDFDLGNSGVVH